MAHRDSVARLNKVLPIPIQLEAAQTDSRLANITNVLVGDHHVISGEAGSSFVTWAIKIVINDLDYGSLVVYKRYSELEALRSQLRTKYPNIEVPELPPKDSVSFARLLGYSQWLERRRKGLQWFLSNVLLNPRLQESDIVKDFIFGSKKT